MATKIRRCLYIGLGGTGMTSLLHTKKMFLETYGEIPPMIAFLGIDTDGGWYKHELESKYGQVRLEPSEQMPILVENPIDYYTRNVDHMAWVPQENKGSMTSMTLGAGQVRTNGRFAFVNNYRRLEEKVLSVVAHMNSAAHNDNLKYELMSNATEVHMVFSMCGGTGAGTFIDMAFLVRKALPDCKLVGYAVLADVFEQMSSTGMAKVKPNALGSLQDLDYLMHMNIDSRITFDYVTSEYEAKQRPFNSFFCIDNKNKNGDVYSHVNTLAEMISLSLVTSAGELSAAAASVSDNLEKNIREGTMDVKNKKAWVAGMGVSQIMFRGKDLASIYAMKASKSLIERMLNTVGDADVVANAWIDRPEVNIRENNNMDHVIDFVLKKQPAVSLDNIDNKQNAMPEIDSYMATAMPNDEDIDARVALLKERIAKELPAMVIKEMNKEGGVGLTAEVLNCIEAQVEIFLREMRSELTTLTTGEKQLNQLLKSNCTELKEYDAKFWKRQSVLAEKEEDVTSTVRNLIQNRRDQVRHRAAVAFFTSVQGSLKDMKQKVKDIADMLQAISIELTQRISAIQNYVNAESQTFQIDLAKNMVTRVTLNNDEISVAEFVKNCALNNKVYDFDKEKKEDVMAMLTDYCMTLGSAKEWASTTIDDIFAKMDAADVDNIIRMALRKAEPLLTFNFQGYERMEEPSDIYYVGVGNSKTSLLARNGRMKNMLPGHVNMDFASLGIYDSVIIYHQVGVVPAYAIAPVPRYEEKARQCNVNCHFNALIERRMNDSGYSLYPNEETDDTLELWVKGIIFGLVKNEDGHYMYVNKKEGKALRKYWMDLSEYRDEAFETFRRNVGLVREDFYAYFDQVALNEGNDAMTKLLNDVAENYLEKYSQVNMTLAQLEARGNERIMNLMENETSYVERELKK